MDPTVRPAMPDSQIVPGYARDDILPLRIHFYQAVTQPPATTDEFIFDFKDYVLGCRAVWAGPINGFGPIEIPFYR